MDQPIDVEKLSKLLALATQSSNEHEARTAAVMFCSLLCKSCSLDQLVEFMTQQGKEKKTTRYEQYVKDQRQARAEYDYKVRTVCRTRSYR